MTNYYSKEFIELQNKTNHTEKEKDYKGFIKYVQKKLGDDFGNCSILIVDNGTIIISRVPLKSAKVNWKPQLFEEWYKQEQTKDA